MWLCLRSRGQYIQTFEEWVARHDACIAVYWCSSWFETNNHQTRDDMAGRRISLVLIDIDLRIQCAKEEIVRGYAGCVLCVRLEMIARD